MCCILPIAYSLSLSSRAMNRLHLFVKGKILAVIDFFYPLFKGIMPLQTFRYAACGGGNAILNILIYFVSFQFILRKQVIYLPFNIAMSAHIAALVIGFLICFPIGFYLSMYVVFPGSELPRRVQLFLYFLVAIMNIALNYFFMKLFVDIFHWYPTPSYILNYILVVCFTYFSQKYFSFQSKK